MSDLDNQIKVIVNDGSDVRARISSAATEAAKNELPQTADIKAAISRVVESAVDAVSSVIPDQQDSVLREILDGLHDGLARTANATSLAIEEAKGNQQAFEENDLKSALGDMDAATGLLADAVENVLNKSDGHLVSQADALRAHAQNSISSLKASIASSLGTAADHPEQLAGEIGEAGKELAKRAKGDLYQAIANALHSAGDRLDNLGK